MNAWTIIGWLFGLAVSGMVLVSGVVALRLIVGFCGWRDEEVPFAVGLTLLGVFMLCATVYFTPFHVAFTQ